VRRYAEVPKAVNWGLGHVGGTNGGQPSKRKPNPHNQTLYDSDSGSEKQATEQSQLLVVAIYASILIIVHDFENITTTHHTYEGGRAESSRPG
jgi:hypothetical protein